MHAAPTAATWAHGSPHCRNLSACSHPAAHAIVHAAGRSKVAANALTQAMNLGGSSQVLGEVAFKALPAEVGHMCSRRQLLQLHHPSKAWLCLAQLTCLIMGPAAHSSVWCVCAESATPAAAERCKRSCTSNGLSLPGLLAEPCADPQATRQGMVDAVQKKDPNAVADKLDQGYKSEPVAAL